VEGNVFAGAEEEELIFACKSFFCEAAAGFCEPSPSSSSHFIKVSSSLPFSSCMEAALWT